MRLKHSLLLPLSLFTLSFMLRLALITQGPYHLDCLELAIQAEKTLETFRIHPVFGTGYPLTVVLGAVFIFSSRLFSIHDPVFAVNFMSVVFGALCVAANYYLVKKLLNPAAAFFSALMFSFFPTFLAVSVYGTSHMPGLFFLLAGLTVLLDFHITQKYRYLIISGILLGLMGAARLQDLILMGIPISYLFFIPPYSVYERNSLLDKKRISSFIFFWVLIGVIAAAFHLFAITPANEIYSKQFSRFWRAGLSSNFMGLVSSSLAFSLQNIVFGLTPIGALLALGGFVLLIKRNLRIFFFLFLWFIVPLAFYGNLETTAPRFLMISVIPLIIAQGFWFAQYTSRPKPVFNFIIAAVFCFIFIFLFHEMYPILKFRHHYALLPDFGRFVAAKTEDHAVIITADEGSFIQYYGKRKFMSKPRGALSGGKETIANFKIRIDELLSENVPVYITGTGLYSYDPDLQFSRMMKNNYRLVYVGEHLTEDWHKGETRHRTGQVRLFRVMPKIDGKIR